MDWSPDRFTNQSRLANIELYAREVFSVLAIEPRYMDIHGTEAEYSLRLNWEFLSKYPMQQCLPKMYSLPSRFREDD
jgi:hypothetical protein